MIWSYSGSNPFRIQFPISVSWEKNFILNCENTWEQYRLPRSILRQTQWPTGSVWWLLSGFLDWIDSDATKLRVHREGQELSDMPWIAAYSGMFITMKIYSYFVIFACEAVTIVDYTVDRVLFLIFHISNWRSDDDLLILSVVDSISVHSWERDDIFERKFSWIISLIVFEDLITLQELQVNLSIYKELLNFWHFWYREVLYLFTKRAWWNSSAHK